MSEDKDKIIRGVYYDATDGFGSIYETYILRNHIIYQIP